MNKKSLAQLYAEHGGKVSDKWTIYLTEYGRIFEEYRDRSLRLLEVGVQNGGSLEIWAKYFLQAQKLVGCDIDPVCASLVFDDPRIAVVIGDANDDATQARIAEHAPAFDIVIDDGSHRSGDIVKSFARYFPRLSDGGVFIVEDLHCSYWLEFEGGLFDPFSSVAFFKRLVDICNYEHWGVEKKRTDVLNGFFSRYGLQVDEETLGQVHSVEFINSLCVIRKRMPEQNTAGTRFIAGAFEQVAPGHRELHSTFSAVLDQSHNEWTARALMPEEELPLLIRERADRDVQIAGLNAQIADLKRKNTRLGAQAAGLNAQIARSKEKIAGLHGKITGLNGEISRLMKQSASLNQAVAAMRNSSSWRITAPVRIVGRQLRLLKRIAKFVPAAIRLGGGLQGTIMRALRFYQEEGVAGIKRGVQIAQTNQQIQAMQVPEGVDPNDYVAWIHRYDIMTGEICASMLEYINACARKPLISVVMPTYNSNPEWLIEAIESVLDQIYPHWELCIADDASTDEEVRKILKGYAKQDPRIKVVYRERNGHISAASNSALELATGEWIALLDHDDVLAEHALFWVVDAINRNPKLRLIYSDEDKIDEGGRRFDPYFKCDWNIDLFYSHNLITHLGVYDASLLHEIGGFRTGFEGAQDYDLALRCVEKIAAKQIHHIPRVLYHWRVHASSTAQSIDSKPYAMRAGEKALNEHFQRQGLHATAELVGIGFRARYALPQPLPLVSLIIPTRNGLHVLRQCIESILKKTSYRNYQVLIIDNGSDDAETLQYLKQIQADARVRVIRDDRPFNYSALNNAAVKLAEGELVGLLNNDLEVISPDWLSEMVSHALRPDVGAVGACLWYPNNTLQHGGVILGIGGCAGHSHKGFPKGHCGYVGRMVLISEFSAVTGACLLTRKKLYEHLGGLNESDLPVAFNDVDFCLRLKEAGYRNVWTPYAELYHHESATRGYEDTPEKQKRFLKEGAYLKRRWGNLLLNDPAYSPNLTLFRQDFSLAWPPRVAPLSPPPREARQVSVQRTDKALAMVNKNGQGLEIGPSHNPLAPKKQGFHVHILDHANAEGLRRKYAGHNVNLDNIEEVDFVWNGEPLHELIGREQCYDWIIASHVIEHVPDVITFLGECERLLKQNGVLSLVIPDKRYCFDYFNVPTSTGELLDAFEQKRKRPSSGKVFDHFAGAAKRNGQIAWDHGESGAICLVHTLDEAREQWERAAASKDYIDVHNWRFTPSSFRLILADLQALGLTRLGLAREFDTEGCEFFVTLRKTSHAFVQDRLVLLDGVHADEYSSASYV